MFWKFTSFEGKLLITNRKSWFIAVFLLFFFLLYFIYYSQEEPATIQEQKRMETGISYAVFDYLDQQRHDIPVVSEVYDYHTQIQSRLGMQVWNIGGGNDPGQYIEDGLEINRLRLKVHELGNAGIPEHLITPKEEILKEDALLHFIKENKLPIESDSFMTNHYVTNVLGMVSGILLLVIVLISGNEILLYELKHPSVLRGIPLSFMKKVTGKVLAQGVFLYTFLIIGFLIGNLYLSNSLTHNGFSFPVLMYQDENYIAVSTSQFLLYLFLGFCIVIILLLLLSILLNMLFRHAFLNILIGLGIFLLPDLSMTGGYQATFLHPIKFVDINRVLTGELAVQLNNPAIDLWTVMVTLSLMCLFLIIIIYAVNKYAYHRVPKSIPLEKVF